MQRRSISPRIDWQKTVESQGMSYHTPDGNPYWNESAYYLFTAAEVDALEEATNTLQSMCMEAVQYVIDKDLFSRFQIPEFAADLIREYWNQQAPSVYGRFDLAYDGTQIKMLEYNADTPVTLLESSVVQWYWLKDNFPSCDQFNSIHERLIEKWKDIGKKLGDTLYFAHDDDDEYGMTAIYMRDVAEQAGIATGQILVSDIGWNGRHFTDLKENQIKSLFKLYPWEWMVREENGPHLVTAKDSTLWIEPIWKMVLSNKAILPILWDMYPGHDYLLEAHHASQRGMSHYARKPLLAREGSNITLVTDHGEIATGGTYGEEGFVFQALANIPNFSRNYPVIGSWVIDGVSAGMGIRESDTMITTKSSRFVPHLFE